MMKFGTPTADDGPGNTSTNPGFDRAGEPSELRSFALGCGECLGLAFFTRGPIRLTSCRGRLTSTPLPVRS